LGCWLQPGGAPQGAEVDLVPGDQLQAAQRLCTIAEGPHDEVVDKTRPFLHIAVGDLQGELDQRVTSLEQLAEAPPTRQLRSGYSASQNLCRSEMVLGTG